MAQLLQPLIFQQRIGAGGPYYASPILNNGHIYFTSARGVITVIEPGDSFKLVQQNDLGERTMATPAIEGGQLFVRTEKALYSFEQD